MSETTNLYLQSLQASWDAHEAHGESLDALPVNKIEKFIATVNEPGRFTLDQFPVLVSFCRREGVNGGVNAVFNYIRLNPGVKVTEMTEPLDAPKRTLERWIKQLRDEKKVVFRGAPKTGGYYVTD